MRIALKHNGEIVAADSRTVYRGLDIGTAKPSPEDQRLVPHHLIDVCVPDEPFNAAIFKDLAAKAIAGIQARGRLPILVGGTGLYVDAVIFDYRFGSPADDTRRSRLNALSVEELQQLCRYKNIDMPINSRNKRHLVRAIELGGLLKPKRRLRPNTLVVGVATDREELRRRIGQRVQHMLEAGVLDEVASAGVAYHWQGEALKGNVYRVLRNVVEGKKSVVEATDELVQSDMALAKRQMTWFRRNPDIVWSPDPDRLLKSVDTFLAHQQRAV